MRFGLPIGMALAALWLAPLGVAAQPDPAMRKVVVTTAQELTSALDSARPGDVIALRPGSYGEVKIQGRRRAGGEPIRIVAENPSQRPAISRLAVVESSDFVIEGLAFVATQELPPAAGLVEIARSENVQVLRSTFDSALDRNHRRARAVQIQQSARVTLADNRIERLDRGVHLVDAQESKIIHNLFSRLDRDGVSAVGVRDLTIQGNRFLGLATGGANRGTFIHFWTRGAEAASSNIRILDNVLIQDTAELVQGIFMGNEDRIPYQNVEISNNLIVLGTPQGIHLQLASNARITRNILVDTQNSIFNNTLRLLDTQGGEVSRNLSVFYAFARNSQVAQRNNLQLARLEAQTRRMILSRIDQGLSGSGEGRVHGNVFVAPEQRTAGPRGN